MDSEDLAIDSFETRLNAALSEMNLRRAKAPVLAAEMGISLSAFWRQMKKRNWTLKPLVSKERRRRASEYIAQAGRKASGEDLYSRLGFAHSQSMYRAFPTFYGCTFREAVDLELKAQMYEPEY